MGKIVITISKVGKPEIDAQGFTGMSCKDATAALERAFGGNAAVTEKPEMYMGENEEHAMQEN